MGLHPKKHCLWAALYSAGQCLLHVHCSGNTCHKHAVGPLAGNIECWWRDKGQLVDPGGPWCKPRISDRFCFVTIKRYSRKHLWVFFVFCCFEILLIYVSVAKFIFGVNYLTLFDYPRNQFGLQCQRGFQRTLFSFGGDQMAKLRIVCCTDNLIWMIQNK